MNDCNVFDATKLVLLARSLSAESGAQADAQSRLAPYFDSSASKSLQDFASKLSEGIQQQLASTLFLSETIADDANMLLLCDPEPLDAPSGRDHKHSGMAGTSGFEILQKARAVAALSLLSTTVTSPQQLLQVYLSAAEVRVQDLLETHLTVGGKSRTLQGTLLVASKPTTMLATVDFTIIIFSSFLDFQQAWIMTMWLRFTWATGSPRW